MAKAEFTVQNLDLRHTRLENIVTNYTATASARKAEHIHATGSVGLWLHQIFFYSLLLFIFWMSGKMAIIRILAIV